MRYGATAVFFAVALLLAGVYFLYVGPAMEEKRLIEDFQKRFFLADPGDIDFIRLDVGEGPVDIAQLPAGWAVIRPGEYVADQGVVNKLLETLSKGRLLKVVGGADEAGRFGMEKPQIVLGLAFADKLDVLRIGEQNPASTGYYAYSERLGKVFLVDKEFVKGIYLKPYDLREKRLVRFEPQEIERIKIRRAKDTIEVMSTEEGWQMLSPLAGKADPRAVEELVDVLSTQKAEAFLQWRPELAGLEEHVLVELFGKGGEEVAVADVYFWGTEGDKGTLFHRPGSGEAARARRDFWVLLDSDAWGFAYRNLLKLDPEKVSRIKISWDGSSYLVEKKGNRWFMNGNAVSVKKISALIESLDTWKAVKVVREDRFPGERQFMVEVESEGDAIRLEVSDFNMDREISAGGVFSRIVPGRPETEKVDYWFARSTNLYYAAVISSLDMKKIKELVEGLANE